CGVVTREENRRLLEVAVESSEASDLAGDLPALASVRECSTWDRPSVLGKSREESGRGFFSLSGEAEHRQSKGGRGTRCRVEGRDAQPSVAKPPGQHRTDAEQVVRGRDLWSEFAKAMNEVHSAQPEILDGIR